MKANKTIVALTFVVGLSVSQAFAIPWLWTEHTPEVVSERTVALSFELETFARISSVSEGGSVDAFVCQTVVSPGANVRSDPLGMSIIIR